MPSNLLINAARSKAEAEPSAAAYTFYSKHNRPPKRLAWGELWRAAERIAQLLDLPTSASYQGVALVFKDEQMLICCLLGVWIRGATAIPAPVPIGGMGKSRCQQILSQTMPDIVLTDIPALNWCEFGIDSKTMVVMGITQECIDSSDSLNLTHNDKIENADFKPEGPALIQLTSGSTSNPKIISLSFDNLIAGCESIAQAYSLSAKSVGVHWLPLYHDMGLIGSVVSPLYLGCHSVITRPTVFLQRPLRWMELISEYRGTITSAPNFALEMLLDALQKHQNQNDIHLDLSSITSFILGGEPVLHQTVNRLLDQLAQFGLKESAIRPSYGLAEAVLLVSAGGSADGVNWHTTTTGQKLASCGKPASSVNVTIRHPRPSVSELERTEGEIWLSGESVGQVIAFGQDWRQRIAVSEIYSGDYGFFNNGDLHISGRDATKLIIKGRNIFVEDLVQSVRDGVGASGLGGVIAFSTFAGGTEVPCIAIESKANLDLRRTNYLLAERFGIGQVRYFQLFKDKLIRTSSGKLKHKASGRMILNGDLEAVEIT